MGHMSPAHSAPPTVGDSCTTLVPDTSSSAPRHGCDVGKFQLPNLR